MGNEENLKTDLIGSIIQFVRDNNPAGSSRPIRGGLEPPFHPKTALYQRVVIFDSNCGRFIHKSKALS